MAAPVQVDDEVELRVDSLAYGGNGVARLDGFVVFVRRGLPGDTVRARVTKVKRNHAEALATEVVEPGPQRVEAPCAHYPACGGCRFQDLAYEAQAEIKHGQVADALRRLGDLPDFPLEPIVPAESPFHYRNKMEYSFTQLEDGPTLGFHQAGRWDSVLEIERCWLTTDVGNAIRNAVRDWAREEGLRAYDQETGEGYLRHLVVREGRNTGQVLVQLVTARAERFERGYLVEVLRRFPEVRSIHWSVNDRPAEVTNLPSELLWGDETIEEELCGLRFRLLAERLPADEHGHGRAPVRGRRRVRRADGRRDGLGPLLRHRHDRPLAGVAGADGVGHRGLGGVGRAGDRERRPQRDHQRGLLRRQRRRGRGGAPRALGAAGRGRRRPAPRGARRERPCAASAGSARRGSSTSRATRRRSRPT